MNWKVFTRALQQSHFLPHLDLKNKGFIAVVDFYDSKYSLYKKWMATNHVRMEQHLAPVLLKNFVTVQSFTNQAYFGLWRYFLFVGQKK